MSRGLAQLIANLFKNKTLCLKNKKKTALPV